MQSIEDQFIVIKPMDMSRKCIVSTITVSSDNILKWFVLTRDAFPFLFSEMKWIKIWLIFPKIFSISKTKVMSWCKNNKDFWFLKISIYRSDFLKFDYSFVNHTKLYYIGKLIIFSFYKFLYFKIIWVITLL